MATDNEDAESITAQLFLSYLYEAGMWTAAEWFCTKSPYTGYEARKLKNGELPHNPFLRPLQTIVKEHCTMQHQMVKLLNMYGKIIPFESSGSKIVEMNMIEFLNEGNAALFTEHCTGKFEQM